MPRDDRIAHGVDDEVVSLARRYRKEAVASLVTVLRDPNSPASSKASASATLLAYSDGKPGQARQLTVADLASMPDDLRMELLQALLHHYIPGGWQALLKQACDDAVAQARLTFSKPNRFRRGPKAANPDAAVAPPVVQPAACISARSSARAAPAAAAYAAPAASAFKRPLMPSPSERVNAGINPPNIVQLPGTRREASSLLNSNAARPPPYGLRYGTVETLERTQDATPSNGGIHPDVVRRSAFKDPLNPWRRG